MKFTTKITEFFKDKTEHMTKNDWIILGIITLIYGIISFINLGSFKNPQTFVNFKEKNTSIIEIQGEAQTITKMRHFARR